MKTLNTKLTWLFAGALILSASPAMAQIAGSQHDLSSGGLSQNTGSSTDQVCVFCHTPHGADTSTTALPLWNKTLPDGTGYTRYSTTGTPSFDSTEADVGSVSLACLSCHDGVQAMDSVINLPGSGGWVASGTNIDSGGLMTGSPVPMLGTDLSDDHPISIPYAAGGCLATDTDGECTATLGDADFFNPWKATINSQPVWWVNTDDGASTAREKLDLPLYTRLENATAEPFVECGSCHDPHNEGSSGATTVAFLRTTNNAGSKICVACHNK